MVTREHIHKTYNKVFDLLKIPRIFRYIHKHSLIVLMYHGVVPDRPSQSQYPDRDDPLLLHVNLEDFKQQMEYLKQNYNIIDIDTLQNSLQNKTQLPGYSVLITFDDGYYNNYKYAYPVLKSLDIPATIFLVTDYVGTNHIFWWDRITILINNTQLNILKITMNNIVRTFQLSTNNEKIDAIEELANYRSTLITESGKTFMDDLESKIKAEDIDTKVIPKYHRVLSWENVKEMNSDFISFEPHTQSHVLLNLCSEDEARDEICNSKATIEKILKKKCNFFSFPGGNCDNIAKSILQEAGISCTFNSVHDFNDMRSEVYELGRFYISPHYNISTFKYKIAGCFTTWCRQIINKTKEMIL